MKIIYSILYFVFMLDLTTCNNIYLYGTSLNTKAVSNANGVNASEITGHSLDDVTQSKSYAAGDNQSNARVNAETIWSEDLQGVNSNSNAVQDGNGNTLADSWTKSFKPTEEEYLNNYFSYLTFLKALSGKQATDEDKEVLQDKVKQSIQNYENPDQEFNGSTSFNMQQSRSSGFNTWSSTNSQIFKWGDNKIHKGSVAGSAQDGWTTTNSNSWSHSRNDYNTVNKNSTAFGQNAYASGETNHYLNDNKPYQSGNQFAEAEGKDAVALSQINNNSFGLGTLTGSSNAYSDQNGAQAVSEYKGM